jgi:phospholipid-binding lipoprotein MlaA
MRINYSLARIALSLAVGCWAAAVQAENSNDPWEGFNRPVFAFNDTLDTYLLRPVAQGYYAVTPPLIDDGVSNFFGNIAELNNMANNALQGKMHAAGVDTARFLINSTVGLLGFFDLATLAGLSRSDEDFGQTLAVWGLVSGPYLVVPLLGPSTPRDFTGEVAATSHLLNIELSHDGLEALEIINSRADMLASDELITGDKYTITRNYYLQHRAFLISDTVPPNNY